MKAGTKKRTLYVEGDLIHAETENGLISGELFSISDTLLIIDSTLVAPADIIKIHDYSRGGLAAQAQAKFIAGGIFYFLLTTVNRAGNQDDPVFTDYNAKVSGGIILAGAFFGLFKKRVYRMNKKGKLAVLIP